MLLSWSKHWFNNSSLIVYGENFSVPNNIKQVINKDWNINCKSQWENFARKTDIVLIKKFAKKGFSFLHAMKTIECDLLIWIDADILFYKNITKEQIQSLLPKNKLIAFFDTYYQQNPNYTIEEYLDPNRTITAAESGFVILNKQHKHFKKYLKNYEDLYMADKKPYFLGNWYDGNVCAGAAFEFSSDIEDLSKLRTTNKTQTPLNRTWLAEYFNHQKGNVKNKINFEKKKQEIGL